MLDRALVVLKPDAVQRRLVGRIITRFEEKGMQILGLKLVQMTEKLARKSYAQHKGKEFFEPLIKFMTSGPSVAMVVAGKNVVEVARKMVGSTLSAEALPGTIRGDYGMSNRFNLIHVSDSPEAADREIALFFKKEELASNEPVDRGWIYDMSGGKPV